MAEAQISNRVTNLKIKRDIATERDVVATWTWNNNIFTFTSYLTHWRINTFALIFNDLYFHYKSNIILYFCFIILIIPEKQLAFDVSNRLIEQFSILQEPVILKIFSKRIRISLMELNIIQLYAADNG